MKIKESFLTNPSKKQLALVTILWFIGITLLTLSDTDFFTESFFQKKDLMDSILIIGATIVPVKLYINYWKNKSINSHYNEE